jgi:hypothetical protein
MRYLIEYNPDTPPPSRWKLLLMRIGAWLSLAAFVALVIMLAAFFFSVIVSIVAALVVIGLIVAVYWRIKYRNWLRPPKSGPER